MLDKYITGNVEKIRLKHLYQSFEHTHKVGGAANVAKNIISLGAKSTLLVL